MQDLSFPRWLYQGGDDLKNGVIVADAEAWEAARARGFLEYGETAEAPAEPVKRGPGRPRKS
jgi:hypothetical protein